MKTKKTFLTEGWMFTDLSVDICENDIHFHKETVYGECGKDIQWWSDEKITFHASNRGFFSEEIEGMKAGTIAVIPFYTSPSKKHIGGYQIDFAGVFPKNNEFYTFDEAKRAAIKFVNKMRKENIKQR